MMSNDVTVYYWTYHVCCFWDSVIVRDCSVRSIVMVHSDACLNLGGGVAFLSVLLLIVFAVRINRGRCRRLKFRVLTSHTDTHAHVRMSSIILVCDHITGVSVVGVHLDAKSMYHKCCLLLYTCCLLHKCWPAYHLKYSVRRKASRTGSLSSVRNELLSSDHWIKLWFKLWTLSRLLTLPLTINLDETLKRLSSLPILISARVTLVVTV